MLDKYAIKINEYLRLFNTEFSLSETKDLGYKGKADKPLIDYNLLFRGKELSFEENDNSVSIKHTLSEGDKSTIAFAFFLSKIDIESNKSDLIILFDDPISSLDTNRRNSTINHILNLLTTVNQLIVLSHNDQFIYEIEKRYRGKKEDIRTLKIFFNKQINSSELHPLDIDSEFQNEYFKSYQDLNNFKRNPVDERSNNEIIISKIRTILETNLKFKFFNNLTTRNGTFGRMIDELESFSVSFRDSNTGDVINKLRELNDISWRPHHGKDPAETREPHEISLSFAEIIGYVDQTLNMIDIRL